MIARLLRSFRLSPRLWSALLLGGVCSLLTLTQHCGEVRLAESEGFAEAARHLVAASPDFTVVWPPHAAAALGALPPKLRAADAVPFEPADQRRYLRLAVIGPAGFDDPPELANASPEPRRRFADVEVGIYGYPVADRILFDLRGSLSGVAVSLRGPEHQVRCDRARRDQGWDCPGRPAWNHVAPTNLRVEGRDWACVWAHPLSNHDLVIDLGRQPLGDHLLLEAALSDDAATTPNGAAVSLRLEVQPESGSPFTRILRRTNQAGIGVFDVATSGLGHGTVQLVIRTSRDARRHLGVGLRIVERGESGAHRPRGDRP